MWEGRSIAHVCSCNPSTCPLTGTVLKANGSKFLITIMTPRLACHLFQVKLHMDENGVYQGLQFVLTYLTRSGTHN